MFLWTLLFSIAQAGTISNAMRLGDCESVLSQTATQPSEHLAHAKCALQNEDWTLAIQSASLVKTGVFQDYARWVEANAYLEKNDPSAASESLRSLSIPGPLKYEVPLMRGKALILAGKSLDARDGLRELLSTNVSAEARYWLARGGEDRGDNGPAIATYQHVWANNVRGQWDEKSAERLKAMGAPVPSVQSSRDIQLVKTRMAALNKERQYGEALTLLRVLHTVTPPTTKDHHLAHARAIFKARNYREAVSAFKRVLGPPAEAKGSANDLFNYGLAHARSGDYDAAIVVYGRLVKQHPTTKRADFGSFKRGYTEYDRRSLEPAIIEFERHIRERKDSKYLDEAIWFLGLCHWLNKSPTQAIQVWETLPVKRPKSPLVPAALYWRARLKGLAGNLELERKGYEELLENTLRQATRGMRRFDWVTHSHNRSALSHPNGPRHSRLGRTYNERMPFSMLAFRSGLEMKCPLSRRSRNPLVEMRGLLLHGDLLKRAIIASAKNLRGRFLRKTLEGGDPVAQQACYPMPEAPIVEQVVEQYGIDPYLPYGVMTAESLLKPWVTSHAGARGLMQLMPEVGERLAKEVFPGKAYHPDQLYTASYNARLGTTELGQRTQALQGILNETSLPAIIASYNGGEAAVRRWAGTYDGLPPFDAYAETIGYAETRRYVRRVLNFIMMYRWVYGDPDTTSPEE